MPSSGTGTSGSSRRRWGTSCRESPPGLRRMALVELIKVDLEYRWQEHNLPRSLAEYLEEFPELAAGGVPCDLVYEEYHVRKQAGDAVDPQQYLEMFPQQAEELGRLLGMEAPHLTTSLFQAEKLPEINAGGQARRVRSAEAARQRGLRHGVPGLAGVDAAVRGPEGLGRSRDRAADAGPAGARAHRARLRSEAPARAQAAADVHAAHRRRHAAGGRRCRAAHAGGGAARAAVVRGDRPGPRATGKSRPPESWTRRKMAAATWPSVVCWLGARLAGALDYAHRRDVLHRDIKPANVLLTEDGSPKLADFNISYSSQVEGATPAAYFGGSLPYMSTEQLEACHPAHPHAGRAGRPQRSVRLGVMLWELLTGKRPFDDSQPDGNWTETLNEMLERRRGGRAGGGDRPVAAELPAGAEGRAAEVPGVRSRRALRHGQRAGARAGAVPPAAARRSCCVPSGPACGTSCAASACWPCSSPLLIPNVICSAINIGYNLLPLRLIATIRSCRPRSRT